MVFSVVPGVVIITSSRSGNSWFYCSRNVAVIQVLVLVSEETAVEMEVVLIVFNIINFNCINN